MECERGEAREGEGMKRRREKNVEMVNLGGGIRMYC
jgi:hypothetical protein